MDTNQEHKHGSESARNTSMRETILEEVMLLCRGNGRKVICFHGPSGTGKSTAAKKVVSALGKKSKIIHMGDIHKEGKLRSPEIETLFRETSFINESRVLIFDNIDSPDSGFSFEFLRLLTQELEELKSGIVFLISNQQHTLTASLLNKINKRVRFSNPTENEIKELIKGYSEILQNENHKTILTEHSDLIAEKGRELSCSHATILGILQNIGSLISANKEITKDLILRQLDELAIDASTIPAKKIEGIDVPTKFKLEEKRERRLLWNLLVRAAWIDGNLDSGEDKLLDNFALTLNVPNDKGSPRRYPSEDAEDCITPFTSKDVLRQALEMLCEILIEDEKLLPEEEMLLRNFYFSQNLDKDKFPLLLEYIQKRLLLRQEWGEILRSFGLRQK